MCYYISEPIESHYIMCYSISELIECLCMPHEYHAEYIVNMVAWVNAETMFDHKYSNQIQNQLGGIGLLDMNITIVKLKNKHTFLIYYFKMQYFITYFST